MDAASRVRDPRNGYTSPDPQGADSSASLGQSQRHQEGLESSLCGDAGHNTLKQQAAL